MSFAIASHAQQHAYLREVASRFLVSLPLVDGGCFVLLTTGGRETINQERKRSSVLEIYCRCSRLAGRPGVLHDLDMDHDQKDPDAGHNQGDLGEQIASSGAEGTRAADAPEGSCQTAALAALDQDQQDHQTTKD